eukprot:3935089-Rhodomonas_salina.1
MPVKYRALRRKGTLAYAISVLHSASPVGITRRYLSTAHCVAPYGTLVPYIVSQVNRSLGSPGLVEGVSTVKRPGFIVRGAGLMVHGAGFMVHGSWFMVQGSWFMVHGAGFRVQGLKSQVGSHESRV